MNRSFNKYRIKSKQNRTKSKNNLIKTIKSIKYNIMTTTLNYILARLNESSTWRGLILVASSVGITFDPSQSTAIIAAGLGLIGLINTFRKSTVKVDKD